METKQKNVSKEGTKTTNKSASPDEKILAVIRIQGRVETEYKTEEILKRLRLKRKYSCSLISTKDNSMMGMLEKVKYFVA
jgi:ribosomal protein L30/L7E